MITAIIALSIICLVLIFFKYDWGIGIYLLFSFLVPFRYLYFGGGVLIGENLLSLILLGVLFLWLPNKVGAYRVGLSMITPFLFLFIVQALFIPFHFSDMPILDQFNLFRIDIMRTFLPFIIISLVCYKKRNAALFTNVMYLAIAISTIYGIFLITMLGQNPYIDIINPILQYDVRDQDMVLEEGIRAFGYISSVYPHVTEYGYFLIFSSVFLIYQLKRDTTIIPKILLGLVLVNVIICGSRSVLLGEAIVILVFLIYNRQFKVILISVILIAIVWVLLSYFVPQYFLFLKSIGDESANGSSVNLRIEQFRGCIDSIQNNPIFGNGYSWTGWYRTVIGRHPTMLSFESILIAILCNNGIMGLIIWGIMVFLVFKQLSKCFHGNKELKRAITLLLIGYFGYTLFTGDYGTFQAMMVFYALIVANEIGYQNNEKARLVISKYKQKTSVQ